MGQRVTLENIARQSNVSLATVSLVLRDKPGVNSDTRKRVLDIAKELGYQPKFVREPQQPGSLTHIGLVMKSRAMDLPQANRFYSHVIAGIETTCRKQRVNLLYATIPVDEANHPIELPRLFYDAQVDGVLLVGAFADQTLIGVAKEQGIPLVLVDAYAPTPVYDSVVSDNAHGAYEAVSYLIQKGHRQIGMIGSLPQSYPSIDDRRAGYLKALQDHGISTPHFGDSYWHTDEAFEAALALLRRQPQITALFGANDESAIGALRAAQTLGRRTPDELSIIGFDDIDLANHVTPRLTTMQVDKVMMGRLAVQLLANRVEVPAATTVTTTIRPRLIERDSVADLR